MSATPALPDAPDAPNVAVTPRSQAGSRPPVQAWLRKYGLLAVFAAMIVFFSLYGPTSSAFPTRANLVTIIGNETVAAIITLAMVVPLTGGLVDLSVGATTGVASIGTATVMSRFNGPVWLAIAVGLLCGLAVGAGNGLIITRYRMDPIIETLGISILLGGVMVWYTGGTTITTGISTSFQEFGSLNWLGLPRLLVVLLPVIAVTWYLLEQTPFGRHLTAIGSNRRSARLVGIRVDRTIFLSLVTSGLLAGIAGVLLTARAGAADTQTGPSYLFPALAAVFLGATTIRPGKPNVLGAIVGVFFVATAVSGLSIAGASAWASGVFSGAGLLLALAMTSSSVRRRRNRPSS